MMLIAVAVSENAVTTTANASTDAGSVDSWYRRSLPNWRTIGRMRTMIGARARPGEGAASSAALRPAGSGAEDNPTLNGVVPRAPGGGSTSRRRPG